MINKVKILWKDHKDKQKEILNLARENSWANVFYDSIKGKEFLNNKSLNIGRWAGGYSFFYVLHRVLSDYKPKRILELGLGESTKFINYYLQSELINTKLVTVEQDQSWSEIFKKDFKLSKNSKIIICPILKIIYDTHSVKVYENFSDRIKGNFDLYVIDGPHGSPHYSRIEILSIAEKFSPDSEFIIIFDDYNRKGEQRTIKRFFEILLEKKIKFFNATYIGTKRVLVIGTEKYKHVASL